MEQTLNCCISENEDIITVGAGVTLSVMAESELLKREAKPLFDAAVMLTGRGKEALEDTAVDTAMETSEDKDTGVKAPTICDEIFQNVNCGFTGSAVPCIKEGGTECHALWEKGCAFSVMGGKAVGTTSCVSACPVGMEIPAVLEQLRDKDGLEARRIIMKYNPMPSVTCRMCGQCEAACIRSKHDRSVGISGVFQAMGDDIAAHPEIFYAVPSGDSGKRIAVKGCGPAGAAAAFYLRKLGNRVWVFEQRSEEELTKELKKMIPDFPETEFSGYIRALSGIGVVFRFGADSGECDENEFDRLAEGAYMSCSAPEFLREVRRGYETANRINLDFGLKSYMKPGKTFIGFDWEAFAGRMDQRIAPISSGLGDRDCGTDYGTDCGTDWEAVSTEAVRCLNCGCYGVNRSCTRAILTALDAQIRTNKRSRRALDFFSVTDPAGQLEPGEVIQTFEIPKSGDYTSGYLEFGHGSGVAFAYLVQHGKIRDARIVYSGIAPVPVRMIETEAFLRGKEINSGTMEQAAALVCREVILTGDGRDQADEMKKLLVRSLEGKEI